MTRLGFNFAYYLCVASLISVVFTLAKAQIGFVSIDCGSNVASYNVQFGTSSLKWVNDDNFVATGRNANVSGSVDQSADNYEALQTFRYFPEPRRKHCYRLPTPRNSSVLIRAMFMHASSVELPLPTSFGVTVNATNWQVLSFTDYSEVDTPQTLEGIFYSPGNVVYLCLNPQTGFPFISSIEIRPLDEAGIMYARTGSQTDYLSTFFRYNSGAKIGSPTVRFPYDRYDRLWYSPGAWSRGVSTISADGPVDDTQNPYTNSLPSAVLKDAWANNSANSSFWISLPVPESSRTTLYVAAYYTELLVTSVNRSFEMWFHSDPSQVSDSSLNVTAKNTNQMVFYPGWNIGSAGTTNFTFEALPGSALGPIVNAIEGYVEIVFDFSATLPDDVRALQALQDNFNLTDWLGDPCLPVAWNWVACETPYSSQGSTARITKILLSGLAIKGIIPPEISQLASLTDIRLDNNSISGSIPDSLALLPNLRVLLLSNNNLTGEVPDSLKTKSSLTQFTYFGNDLLTDGSSPPSGIAPSPEKSNSKINIGVIAGVVGGVLVLLIGTCLVILGCCYHKNGKPSLPKEKVLTHPEAESIHDIGPVSRVQTSCKAGQVSLETVLLATNNYEHLIGVGSYGSVYHGTLGGKEVAVKVNDCHSVQRNHEFLTEVDILTRVHHVKLVPLHGYCNEGDSLILIYEYQQMGTLRDWLYVSDDRKTVRGYLDWPQRLQIALDTAQGLEYLHNGCTPPIVHRDVKSSNILLDAKLGGKVADFGVCKTTLQGNHTSAGYMTGVKGTLGYLDPEYGQTCILTEKSDVYSFGVVLAEIICGRPPFKQLRNGSYEVLLDTLQDAMRRADIRAVVDRQLNGEYDEESMWRLADIAMSCVEPKSEDRPSMVQVTRNLQTIASRLKDPIPGYGSESPVVTRSGSFGFLTSDRNPYQNLK